MIQTFHKSSDKMDQETLLNVDSSVVTKQDHEKDGRQNDPNSTMSCTTTEKEKVIITTTDVSRASATEFTALVNLKKVHAYGGIDNKN